MDQKKKIKKSKNKDIKADLKAESGFDANDEMPIIEVEPKKAKKISTADIVKSKLSVVIDVLSEPECSNGTRQLAVRHLKEIMELI